VDRTRSERSPRRFGIRSMLFVLPLIVFLGSSGLLIWGTLAAVVFLQGGEYVLRYSLDKSSAILSPKTAKVPICPLTGN